MKTDQRKRYFLSPRCALKRLEVPSVYHIEKDELYELDEEAFDFLAGCAGEGGITAPDGSGEFLEYAIGEDIIGQGPVDVRRPPVSQSPVPSLRYLELQITRRCNLRCRHCYVGPPEDIELSVEKISDILAGFEELQGLRLLITGGEPLLHRDFRLINRTLNEHVFRKILFTNGTLLEPGTVRSLAVDELQISIDGLREGHDALRGRGTYEKAIAGVMMAREAGLDVSVSTMVHSRNTGEFEGMEKLFRGLGIKEWTVDVPCVEGNLRKNPLFQLDPEAAGPFLRYGFGEGLHGGGEGFACGLHLAAVTSDGKVCKCAFYADRPGGSIDEGLRACWERIVPSAMAELSCDCAFAEICRGGCRYRAELLGDCRAKDPYRCAAYGLR